LLFLFTIIILRSLATILRRSFDEVMTTLRRICDDFIIWHFEMPVGYPVHLFFPVLCRYSSRSESLRRKKCSVWRNWEVKCCIL